MAPSSSHLQSWLALAILAPSAHNTQPWECCWADEKLTVTNDVSHTLQAGDPTLRQTFLSIGAFLENLSLAAGKDHFNMIIESTAFTASSGAPIAVVHFEQSNNELIDDLVTSIPKRHTNRGLYEPELTPTILTALSFITHTKTVSIDLITDPSAKERIGSLVQKGIFIGLSLNPLKEELADLVSFKDENRNDGLQVEAMNQHPRPADSGRDWLLHKLDPTEEAEFNFTKFSTAPVIAIISTSSEGPIAWIEAGRVLERLLLTAAREDLTHCISAAPVEIPTLAPLLRAETSTKRRPQVVVRLGIPKDPSFTVQSPRRPLSSMSNV